MDKPSVIIQARYGSARLLGKVLLPLPIADPVKNVLHHVHARAKASPEVDRVIIATTVDPKDNVMVSWAEKNGALYFRGSEMDVLDRYYKAAAMYEIPTVVRITSDCPCIDTGVLSDMIRAYTVSGADYMSNSLDRTFAHGLDVEIFSFATLEKAWLESKEMKYREHVTLYIYESGKFNCMNYINPAASPGDESIRVTLDTVQDYTAICAIYDLLGESFSYEALLSLIKRYPWISLINSDVVQKKRYETPKAEIIDAVEFLEKQDMPNAAAALLKACNE